MELELSFDVTFFVVASGYNLPEISNADSSKNLINKSKLLSSVLELKPTGFFNLKTSQRDMEGWRQCLCSVYSLRLFFFFLFLNDACKDKTFLVVTFWFGEAFRSSPQAGMLFIVCLIFITVILQCNDNFHHHFLLWLCGLLSRRRWRVFTLPFLQHSEFTCWLIPLMVSQSVVLSVGLNSEVRHFFHNSLTWFIVEAWLKRGWKLGYYVCICRELLFAFHVFWGCCHDFSGEVRKLRAWVTSLILLVTPGSWGSSSLPLRVVCVWLALPMYWKECKCARKLRNKNKKSTCSVPHLLEDICQSTPKAQKSQR